MPENTNRSLAFDAEGISYKMECGISALDAIRTAMDEGPAAAETFTGALYRKELRRSAVCGVRPETQGRCGGRRAA